MFVDEAVHEGLRLDGIGYVDVEAEKVELKKFVLTEIDLSGVKLDGLDLEDGSIKGCNLANLRSRNCTIDRVQVEGSRLTGAALVEPRLVDVVFRNSPIDLSSFRFGRLNRVRLEGCRLIEADFQGVIAKACTFIDCALTGAQLSQGNFAGSAFRGCRLTGVGGFDALKGAQMAWEDVMELATALPPWESRCATTSLKVTGPGGGGPSRRGVGSPPTWVSRMTGHDRGMGFTRAELEAFRDQEVPDLLGPRLSLLFVGINPGLWTAAVQTHFAHPANRFYPALLRAGIIECTISPADGMTDEDRAHVTARGIGITNLVRRATARASELSTDELRAGGERLYELVAERRPAVVAVAGITAYRQAFEMRKAVPGRQPESADQAGQWSGAALWVVPNPSGLNAHETVATLAGAYRAPAREAGVVAA